ncbi:hypothetical protein [Sphingomonas sp. CFBP 13706]|uniref:hypothetical protein n=1 Tax=Sphingomonas sp. CFBP 13706 TaxID=2775314 RepID=UPI00177AA661|nr:hypothetical protein [Sphingomonas sp. CFBP 13706]MBD8737221.1 hypothetical protein [Sphingomonas sp. CFBP 13706]
MTPRQRRYVSQESVVGAVISAVLSIVFVLLVFGRIDRVPLLGSHGLIVDAVPQGFAIALMATLVPKMLTKRRLILGKVEPITGRMKPRLHMPTLRLLIVATMGAGLTVAATSLPLLSGIKFVNLTIVVVAKALWGMTLGAAFAAASTRETLLNFDD